MTNSYKETMNLPETDFPMRGNLPKNEPARLQFWNDIDIYHKAVSYTHLDVYKRQVLDRLHDLGGIIVHGATMRGMREQRDTRIIANQALEGFVGLVRNVSELFAGRLDLERAVSEPEESVLTEFAARNIHDEE